MKNILLTLFFKLSYNKTLLTIAKKFFVHFPSLKHKLISLRDRGYTSAPQPTSYKTKNHFLDSIKQEVQNHKKNYKG